MPQGLQVWDAAAGLTLDTSSNIGRVIGTIALSANSASYLDVTLGSGETLWVVLLSVGVAGQNSVWISGANRINWNVITAGTLLYGVS